jgi:hypothetical protein
VIVWSGHVGSLGTITDSDSSTYSVTMDQPLDGQTDFTVTRDRVITEEDMWSRQGGKAEMVLDAHEPHATTPATRTTVSASNLPDHRSCRSTRGTVDVV